MSYTRQAVAYRDREIQTASPSRLVVLVFDCALSNLLRARRAVQTQRIEERVDAVGKARDAIMELLVTLNVEQGGDLARNLQLDLHVHPVRAVGCGAARRRRTPRDDHQACHRAAQRVRCRRGRGGENPGGVMARRARSRSTWKPPSGCSESSSSTPRPRSPRSDARAAPNSSRPSTRAIAFSGSSTAWSTR